MSALLLICLTALVQTSSAQPFDISFTSQDHTVHGRFFPASGEGPHTTVLVLHGFPGNTKDVLGLGEYLAAANLNTLTFNYSGTFGSKGEFGMESTIQDIDAALDYLHQNDVVIQFHIDTTAIILGGYSYGGGMALVYAAEHPEITRVFSIAGTDHGEFAREFKENREFAGEMEEAFVSLQAPDGPVHFDGKAALSQLADHSDWVDLRLLSPKLATHDILVVGGLDDPNVTMEHHLMPFYRALENAGAKNVRFVTFQTDHSFHHLRADVAEVVLNWIQSAPDEK